MDFSGVVNHVASLTVAGEHLEVNQQVTVEENPTTGLHTVTVDSVEWTNQASQLVDGMIQGAIQAQSLEGYSFVLCKRASKLIGILYTTAVVKGGIADPDPGAGAWEADEEGAGGGEG